MLVSDIRWREPYVSAGLNRKLAGVLQPGVYWGFEVAPAEGLAVRIWPGDDPDYPESVAIVDRDGYSVTVRQSGEEACSLVGWGGASPYVVLEMSYAPTQETLAAILAVSVPAEHHIVLARVAIPAGATAITVDMINFEPRTLGQPAALAMSYANSLMQVLASYVGIKASLRNLEQLSGAPLGNLALDGDTSIAHNLSVGGDAAIAGKLAVAQSLIIAGQDVRTMVNAMVAEMIAGIPALPGAATADVPGIVALADVLTTLAGTDTVRAVSPAALAGVLHGFAPGCYARDVPFAAKPVVDVADRCVLLTPARLAVEVNGKLLYLTAQQAVDLSLPAVWDTSSMVYTVAANRAGRNFYIYACLNATGVLKLLASANSTYPTGYTAATSRKLGGFHCLCANVGTIAGHALSGYQAGDILPASVWDLLHRPRCAPEGMVYVADIDKWVDIYLPSVNNNALVSVYGGIIVNGDSAPSFDWYDFVEWYARSKKRLLYQHEFIAFAVGSNAETSIQAASNPGTTGGHIDTAARRMISYVGGEDACGTFWQYLMDTAGGGNLVSDYWYAACNINNTLQQGSANSVGCRLIAGGDWAEGTHCGPRSGYGRYDPTTARLELSARGISDPLHIGM